MAPMGAGLLLLLPELDPPGSAVFSPSRDVFVVDVMVKVDIGMDDDDFDDGDDDVIEIPGGEAYRVSTPPLAWHCKME